MSDGDDGGLVNGAAEPSGGVSGSATPTPEPSKGRGKRKLGLAAVVIGVLGAAVWFVGPSLIPEQCFVDGVETPCDVADVQFVVAPPLPASCFLDGVEIPCEDMPAEGEQCWADEAMTVEFPCADSGHREAHPLLTGSGITVSGFPESKLDDARSLRDEIAGSVFAVGPVLPSGAQDATMITGTAWLIHPRFAITNQHVIAGSQSVIEGIEGLEPDEVAVRPSDGTEVTLYLYPDRRKIQGRVAAVDVELDVAVIELLESSEREPLIVADGPAIGGEPVMYVGHPTRMEQLWVTGLGVVTGYQMPLERASVLSTVPGEKGASGSPILNLDGEVVSLLTGGLIESCSLDSDECIPDSTVQYASLPVGPTATRGIDGPAIRKFFTQATGETLPPSGSADAAADAIIPVPRGSLGSFAVYREREQALEAGKRTTVSGFPVAERATVAAMYDRLAEAVFIVEGPDGAGLGTAWLAGPTTVVTNEHVTASARSGDAVTLRRRDLSTIQARIVEESVADDVSVLRLDNPLATPPLRIANQNADLNVPVFYIGNPSWMEQAWITGLGVTTGYDTTRADLLLTSVPSAGGASGSPIFNLDGEVVALLSFGQFGLTEDGSLVADSSVQYFSIPVSRSEGGVDASTLRSYVERHLS